MIEKLKNHVRTLGEAFAKTILAPIILADLERTIADRMDGARLLIASLEADVLMYKMQIDLLTREKADLSAQLRQASVERDMLATQTRVLTAARDENSTIITKLRDDVFALRARLEHDSAALLAARSREEDPCPEEDGRPGRR